MAFGFLIPEANSAPPKARRRYMRWSMIWGLSIAFGIVALVALREETAPRPLLIAIAGVVFIALVAATREFIILMGSLDELQSRVHMTALAIGFGLTAILVMLWETVSFATGAPRFEAILVFPIGVFGYYAALHGVLRRYS